MLVCQSERQLTPKSGVSAEQRQIRWPCLALSNFNRLCMRGGHRLGQDLDSIWDRHLMQQRLVRMVPEASSALPCQLCFQTMCCSETKPLRALTCLKAVSSEQVNNLRWAATIWQDRCVHSPLAAYCTGCMLRACRCVL